MINKDRLQEVLAEYKSCFVDKLWPDEQFKWEAVQCFQDNWDVNAPDFADMLSRSLEKTSQLLLSANHFPKGMILEFAEAAPEEVRSMFLALFEEGKDVFERMDAFKRHAADLLERYGNGAVQHYQDENAISTYLWLRYPDKYYIYKFSEVKIVASKLEANVPFKKGAYANNIRNFIALYDDICAELQQDDELRNLLDAQITTTCYPDPELRTLTIDVGFFISRYYEKNGANASNDEWWPSDYTPALSVEDWVALLQDPDVFTDKSLQMMKRIKDYGGQATCKQLSIQYGGPVISYIGATATLAKRILKKKDLLPYYHENGKAEWWPILYVGRWKEKSDDGAYIWKLRDELAAALENVDLTNIPLFEQETTKEGAHNYWFLNANPKIWSMSSMPVGAVQYYTLYNDNGNKRRIFQNFLAAKAGDLVIGYESSPVKQIVAILRVSAEQDGEKIYFEKLEGLSSPIDFATLKGCAGLEQMEYFTMQQGSLFKLNRGEYDLILDLIREENPIPAPKETITTYGKADFLHDVYLSEAKYDRLVAVLRRKKNIILQGAPGVGKTYAAMRLAYAMMGEVDQDRVELVQFHQNYSYEDFVMGYKPVQNTFELKNGIFYRFCQKASNHPDKDYIFIIDEINRGNLSKIFGELLMLIEVDYRDKKATLAYNGLSFSVPKRLHIIGMMNTADRSLAMIDYALRRRFSFFDMEPGFDSEGFLKYQDSLGNETFNRLIDRIKELNREIAQDPSLGKGFCIGHSYFCNAGECTEEWMKDVVDFDILPMLSEYWFDNTAKLQQWENILHGVFQ
jgi:5-methylcytosine-specific restriction protein B